MPALRKLAFLLESFATPSPSQQLLDRFLSGYPRNGGFPKPDIAEVWAYLPASSDELQGRTDAGLRIASSPEVAVAQADAVIIVPRQPASSGHEPWVETAIERAAPEAACFVHGTLANSWARARDLAKRAATRRMKLLAGTELAVTWRLPDLEVPSGTSLVEALIVVQVQRPAGAPQLARAPGTPEGAALNGLEGLWPLLEKRRGGEAGVRSVLRMHGANLWRAGDQRRWSWPLLAAALARSDSPQGDAVRDGRNQDLVGLGLVAKLARDPFGWQLEHVDGLRSSILVLDGVVADIDVAIRSSDGRVWSAQIFQAPPPQQQHFSQLCAVLEEFFCGGSAPWSIERGLLTAGLLEAFRRATSENGRRIPTPQLRRGA